MHTRFTVVTLILSLAIRAKLLQNNTSYQLLRNILFSITTGRPLATNTEVEEQNH